MFLSRFHPAQGKHLTQFSSRQIRCFASTVMACPLPLILCGRTAQIAMGVKKGLEPEYEVVHIILSPSSGISEIPSLLSTRPLPPASLSEEENLGTRNYARKPVAVILGAGYDDQAFKLMFDAAKGRGKGVPWLRPDASVKTPPLGPKYGEHMVGRVKACLERLKEEGKLEEVEGEGGEVLF